MEPLNIIVQAISLAREIQDATQGLLSFLIPYDKEMGQNNKMAKSIRGETSR